MNRAIDSAVVLRTSGADSLHGVLATYSNRAGADVFALCRAGLPVFNADGAERFIADIDIEKINFVDGVKTVIDSRRLMLTLVGGEKVDLRVEAEHGQFLDVFRIHRLLRRRVHQARRGVGLPGVL